MLLLFKLTFPAALSLPVNSLFDISSAPLLLTLLIMLPTATFIQFFPTVRTSPTMPLSLIRTLSPISNSPFLLSVFAALFSVLLLLASADCSLPFSLFALRSSFRFLRSMSLFIIASIFLSDSVADSSFIDSLNSPRLFLILIVCSLSACASFISLIVRSIRLFASDISSCASLLASSIIAFLLFCISTSSF